MDKTDHLPALIVVPLAPMPFVAVMNTSFNNSVAISIVSEAAAWN
jgi:hypothetical protein